ncbi:MAG: BatA domain-containing protein [Planctomycetota bacterium]
MIFQSPALLAGLALIAVPIIIHLINKRKFRVVDWAPMKYLRQSLRTTRRRIRLEQLLLLLTRILFVAALVLAVSRPLASGDGGLGWAGVGSRTSRLLVVDDSLSMGRKAGTVSDLGLAREAALRVIGAAGKNDSLTVLRATAPLLPLLRETAVGLVEDPRGLLESLEPSDAAPRWAEVLEEVRRRLEAAAYPLAEVTIFTDRQSAGWDESVTEVARRLARPDLRVRVVDVGIPVQDNAALVGLRIRDAVAVPAIETRFSATIRNDGTTDYGPVEALIAVGEAKRTVTIPRVAAGSTLEVPLAYRFARPGLHTLTLELPDDALPGDNRRHCLVEVREQLDLVLVDGSPSNVPFESETDFLSVAFTIGEIPWRVFAETDSEWLSHAPAPAELTVLANLASIGADHVERLEALVREGMGLFVFPGDQSDPTLLNDALHRGGEGLLPARVEGVLDEPVRGLAIDALPGSPLEALRAIAPEALAEIGASRRLLVRVDESDRERTRVLARWDDAESSPAVVERRFGRGRVLFFTTTADRDWSDWPVDPTFLLGLREAGLVAAHPGLTGLNGEAGGDLVIETGSSDVSDAGVIAPGETEPRQPEIERVGEAGETLRLRLAGATRAGTWRASWTDHAGLPVSRAVALNPAVAESDAALVSRAELETWLGPLRPEILHHAELAAALEGSGRELWRLLLGLVLAFLAVETVLMVWVGRKG